MRISVLTVIAAAVIAFTIGCGHSRQSGSQNASSNHQVVSPIDKLSDADGVKSGSFVLYPIGPGEKPAPDLVGHYTLDVTEGASGPTVTIHAKALPATQSAYFLLKFDDAAYTPKGMAPDGLFPKDRALSLSVLDVPKCVPIGFAITKPQDGLKVSGDGLVATVSFSKGASAVKKTSTAPTGAENEPKHAFAGNYGATVIVTWDGANVGDYNVDGEVGISDLGPLAATYAQHVSYQVSGDPAYTLHDEQLAQVDGNDDAEIGIADLIPLASNYAVRLYGYNVYRDTTKLPNPTIPTDSASVDFPGPTGDGIRPGVEPQFIYVDDISGFPGAHTYKIEAVGPGGALPDLGASVTINMVGDNILESYNFDYVVGTANETGQEVAAPTEHFLEEQFVRVGKTLTPGVNGIGCMVADYSGNPVPGVSLECRDTVGNPVGTVHYFNDAGDLESGLTQTSSTGFAIITDVPQGLNNLRITTTGGWAGTTDYFFSPTNPSGTTTLVQFLPVDISHSYGSYLAHGFVVDAMSTATIPSASIQMLSMSGVSSTSQADGSFSISVPSAAPHVAKCTKAGYVDSYSGLLGFDFGAPPNDQTLVMISVSDFNSVAASLGIPADAAKANWMLLFKHSDMAGANVAGCTLSVYNADGSAALAYIFYGDASGVPTPGLTQTTSSGTAYAFGLDPAAGSYRLELTGPEHCARFLPAFPGAFFFTAFTQTSASLQLSGVTAAPAASAIRSVPLQGLTISALGTTFSLPSGIGGAFTYPCGPREDVVFKIDAY